MSKDTEEEKKDWKKVNSRIGDIERAINRNPEGLRPRIISLEANTEIILKRLRTITSRQWKILVMVVASLIAMISAILTFTL